MLPLHLRRATMTSERKAQGLVNLYTRVGVFDWSTRSKDALGITITFILGPRPRRDIWHYIGVVLEERRDLELSTSITQK